MQVYNDDGSTVLITNDGTVIRHTEYENWVIDQIAREYLKSDKAYSPLRPHEIAEFFPEGKTYLNQRRKEINAELNGLLLEDQAIEADQELGKIKNKDLKEHKKAMVQIKRDRLLEERTENDLILSFLNPRKKKYVQDFQVSLANAKKYPIDKLLVFKQKKAQCLWHNDKNPSLYYYRKDNRVHCFVCENGGDSIDVVMQQRNCSIGEAVAFLNQA